MTRTFSGALVAIFLLTTVAFPHLTTAQQATPIVSESTETPIVSESPDTSTPVPNGDSQVSEPPAQIPATPGPDARIQGDVSPNAELTAGFGVVDASWDPATNLFQMNLYFFPGFVAEVGDTIEVFYTSNSLSLGSDEYVVPGHPIVAQADNASEVITLTFTDEFAVEGSVNLSMPGEVLFPVCQPNPSGYTESANIVVSTASYYPFFFSVDGPDCEPAEGASVQYIDYIPQSQVIPIELEVSPGGVVAGTQITITYPADVLAIEPGPVEFLTMPTDYVPVPQLVATGVADNGLITITFEEYVPHPNNYLPIDGYFRAEIITGTCDPNGGLYTIETNRIVFVANPGGTFDTTFPTSTESGFRNEILCNAAPASKTGVLSEDGTHVHWTIDTGHLINGAIIQDASLLTDQTFLCETVVVTTEPAGLESQIGCDSGNGSVFTVLIINEGVTRATINVTSEIMSTAEDAPITNCAFITAGVPSLPMQTQRSVDTNGVGGTVCAQVFPEGGGDFINVTTSATEVHPNETLTYDVSFATTTALWWSLPLTIEIPDGLEPTNVECTFDPVESAEGDCEVLADGTISVGLRRSDAMTEPVGGGTITVSITGTVSAEPGTEMVTHACGERRLDVPTNASALFLIGLETGPHCDSASTMVVSDDVVPPTPTPTPTATQTPTPTPTVVVTPTPVVTETPAATATPSPTSTPVVTATIPVTETPVASETSVPQQKVTVVRVADDDNSSFEGTPWSLYAPVASQTLAAPYLSGVLDANNSMTQIDVPAGEYRFVVSPEGMAPQEFVINITDESQEIVVYLQTDATPGVTATISAEPTATSQVTGLPDTGNGEVSSSGTVTAMMMAAVVTGAIIVLGLRTRSSRTG